MADRHPRHDPDSFLQPERWVCLGRRVPGEIVRKRETPIDNTTKVLGRYEIRFEDGVSYSGGRNRVRKQTETPNLGLESRLFGDPSVPKTPKISWSLRSPKKAPFSEFCGMTPFLGLSAVLSGYMIILANGTQ